MPNNQHFVDLLETKPWGEIVINEKCETSQPGVFACGDVTTTPYKQIAIAMGEGSKAVYQPLNIYNEMRLQKLLFKSAP